MTDTQDELKSNRDAFTATVELATALIKDCFKHETRLCIIVDVLAPSPGNGVVIDDEMTKERVFQILNEKMPDDGKIPETAEAWRGGVDIGKPN